MGLKFPNPLGLAAGFDKSGVALSQWGRLGFGFAEIGTVTPQRQRGNPKPRLFRLPEDRAIINRMGFNNDGAERVASRLNSFLKREIPLGINIGKQKETPGERAVEDYVDCYQKLAALADYVVVNVSSPNTPSLRDLQDASPLKEIITALCELKPQRPVLVKIAPDLENRAIEAAVRACAEGGGAGIIATNTTVDRKGLRSQTSESGGISGAPLFSRSNEVLSIVSKAVPAGFVVVGVGGIFSGADLREKLSRGADLAQIYTGWIYGGPASIAGILAEFLEAK